jgi:hypothetical protein
MLTTTIFNVRSFLLALLVNNKLTVSRIKNISFPKEIKNRKIINFNIDDLFYKPDCSQNICNKCNGNKVQEIYTFKSCPDVVIYTLKRFQFNEKNRKMINVFVQINFDWEKKN